MAGLTGGAKRPAPAPRPPAARVTAQTLDVVQYIADMTAQLEGMAVAAHFDMLAYFLGMAKAESELLVRTSPGHDPSPAETPVEDEEAPEAPQDDFQHGDPAE